MPKPIALIGAACALLVLAGAGVALAQSGACPDCVQEWNFDSSTQGWASSDTRWPAQWLASHDFGFLITSSASGVMHTDAPVSNLVYLNAGVYQIKFRAGRSGGAPLCTSSSLTLDGGGGYWESIRGSYDLYQTEAFTLTTSGYQTFRWRSGVCGGDYYFDYIHLVSVPVTSGTGTPTPMPATATPLPVGTEYCVTSGATATPTPGSYSLTPVPTATAVPSGYNYYDSFERTGVESTFWSVNGTIWVITPGHGGIRAARLPSASDPGASFGSLGTTPALIRAQAFPGSYAYVDLWAMADYVGSGQTQSLGIWLYSTDDSNWHQAGTVNISMSGWYPWHLAITLDRTYTVLAIIAYGDATGGNVFVDDVHLYQDLSGAKNCSTGLPPDTTHVEPSDWSPSTNDWTYTLYVPSDRACPSDIQQPNNFWGPILTGATQFLDHLTQSWGSHVPGFMTSMAETLIRSPILVMASLAALFVDLRMPLAVAGVIIAMTTVQALWSIWIMIKSTVFAR